MDNPTREAAGVRRRGGARFAIRVPVFYRLDGGRRWFHGEAANIGATGVLFRGACRLDPGRRVHLVLALAAAAGASAALVVCRARIVRVHPSIYADGSVWLAAMITRSRLLPPPTVCRSGGRRGHAPEVDGGTTDDETNSSLDNGNHGRTDHRGPGGHRWTLRR